VPGDKSRFKYHCVEVIAPSTGCAAARELKGVRLLSAEAPRLPLSTCDQPSDCKCKYRHFDDRRQGSRRDDEDAAFRRPLTGPERRKRLGRRDSDYN
jgi:predicted metal-binding protein